MREAHELCRHGVIVELGHGAGPLLVVELGEDLAAQARVEALDDVGDVGGVHVVEGLVRDGELDVGQVALDEVHVAPRDDALGDRLAKGPRELEDAALEGRRERA